jgi:hypothetical protein
MSKKRTKAGYFPDAGAELCLERFPVLIVALSEKGFAADLIRR